MRGVLELEARVGCADNRLGHQYRKMETTPITDGTTNRMRQEII